MKRRRITSFMLVLTLIFSLLTGTTLAEGTYANSGLTQVVTNDGTSEQTTGGALRPVQVISNDISATNIGFNVQMEQTTPSVYVRIEGDTDTFIPRTKVEVEDFDLSEYGASKSCDGVSVIQAIIRALEVSGLDAKDEGVISHGGGSYISSICGLEAGAMSGWMYTLNGEAPNLGVNQQPVKEGDQIVLYFIEDWVQSSYAYFTEEEKEIAGGEAVELTLMHNVLDMNTWESTVQPCDGASILVGEEVVGTTDEDGKITLNFDQAGTYYVSANKTDDYGVNLISRPYCEIKVTSDSIDETLLKMLKISSTEIKLSPEFSSDVENYSMEIPAAVSELSSYPTAQGVNSKVYAIASWDETVLTMSDAGEIHLADIPFGESILTYVVEAANSETREYNIKINRLVASEPVLETLSVSSGSVAEFKESADGYKDGTLSQCTYNKDQNTYEVSNTIGYTKDIDHYYTQVNYDIDKLCVTPKLGGNTPKGYGKIEIINETIGESVETTSEVTSSGISLAEGENQLKIITTSQDSTTQKTYYLTVKRLEKSNFNYKTAMVSAQKWVQSHADFSNATYKIGTTPDWNAFALVRSGAGLSDSYYEGMKSMISGYGDTEAFKAAMKKVTEYERMAIGITASGNNATNVSGVNLIEGIYNSAVLTNQGVNGVTYGLLAIDSHQYEVPSDALYTREKMVDILLEQHIPGQGWGYSTKSSDIDLTAMTIQALTPYYKDSQFAKQSEVKEAVDEAITYLSNIQQADGTYKAYGSANPESAAQVIVALSGLGIDCQQDIRFIKGGNTLITALEQFYSETDGGFKHSLKEKKANAIATQQVLYGLAAYDRFLNGANNLYDLTDINFDKKISNTIELKNEETATLISDYEEVQVNVAENFKEVNLDIDRVIAKMPKVSITFESNTIVLPKDIQMVGQSNKLLLKMLEPKSLESEQEQLKQAIKDLEEVKYAFDFGNEGNIQCDQFMTFTLKNKGNYEAGYIDHAGKVHPIVKAPENVEGLAEYCIAQGNDLIIKTKHLTTFFVYSKQVTNDSENKPDTGNNTPVIENVANRIKVNISVDAKTISKDYLVSPREIQLHKGATAYEALVSLGLQLDTTGSDTNVYVAAIDGLGEFDHGTLSGWMYSVNGVFPNVSLGSYILSDGDVIQVRYTTNGGKDLGDAAAALFKDYVARENVKQSNISYSVILSEAIGILENKSIVSEWELIGLAHKEKLSDTARKALVNAIIEIKGDYRKVTDLERMIIALGAAGYDAQDIQGINLVKKLYDRDSVTNQGSNGVIFALIALDSRQYQVPNEAKWTREKLIETLLGYQNTDGGFALAKGEDSNIDITAMALCSLAPYKEEQKASIDKALEYLSKVQKANGELSYEGVESSESTAQAIIALCTLGINPVEDTRFIKEENNLIQVLLNYYVEKAGFKHVKDGQANQMATEQAVLALLSYEKLLQSGNDIYCFEKASTPVIEVNKVIEETETEAVASLEQFKDGNQVAAWAREDMQRAILLGIIQGDQQMIKPKDKVTRAEFVTMLLKVLEQEDSAANQQEEATASAIFKDVPSKAWYNEAVYKANALKLVNGVSEEYFMPNAAITREQMAVMMSRLIDMQESGNKPTDFAEVATWAQSAVLEVYGNDLMQGDSENFAPKQEVTREMATVILMRFDDRYEAQKAA